jgi:ppGpp synthetase/RelA/SpoT-type nucleotidyltranferase
VSPFETWTVIALFAVLMLLWARLDRLNERQTDQARADLGYRQVEDAARRLAAWDEDMETVERCWADRSRVDREELAA